MKMVLIAILLVSVACTVGCHPRKTRPLEEEESEDVTGVRQRTEESQLEQELGEKPITPIAKVQEDEISLGHVNFEYDKYNLTDQAVAILSENAAILMENPSMYVMIEGHCDERGTEEYNLALGEKRALAVRDFMMRFGIAKSRLSIISYGEESPLDPGHNEDAWAKNRRAAFVTR